MIVATQMLESMIHSPTPTRAEASDVANAVYEGADAVMLSAETAAGAYPVEAVTIMERIIMRAEGDPAYHRTMHIEQTMPEATEEDAITAAARQAAETIGASAIVTYTSSGDTTLRAARERPTVPILALTTEETVARSLTLTWGVHPVFAGPYRSFREMIAIAEQRGRGRGLLREGLDHRLPRRLSGRLHRQHPEDLAKSREASRPAPPAPVGAATGIRSAC